MSLILSLESATSVCSVALHNEGRRLSSFDLFLEKAHSKSLATLVDNSFEYAGIEKSDLSAVAISKGPGSYTGLRIGTSLAKGICFGLDVPLISINSLEAMAWNAHTYYPDGILCPMIDARRMEVYYLLKDQDFNTVAETSNLVVEEDSFSGLLKEGQVVFFGDGASKCKAVLGKNPNALFNDQIQPSAQFVGELAYKKYIERDFEDLAYFEPFYLKEFIAGKPKKLV